MLGRPRNGPLTSSHLCTAQILWLRRADVIVGMHGGGLINVHFMRLPFAAIELMPPGVHTAEVDGFFASKARGRGGFYRCEGFRCGTASLTAMFKGWVSQYLI